MRRFSYERLFDGNILVLGCVLFTFFTVANVIVSAAAGNQVSMSSENIIWSLIYLSAPLLPMALVKYLWRTKVFTDKDYLFWMSIPLHFVVSLGLTYFYTFIQSIISSRPFSTGILLNIFIQFTIAYTMVNVGAVIIDLVQTALTNRELKKIQGSQLR